KKKRLKPKIQPIKLRRIQLKMLASGKNKQKKRPMNGEIKLKKHRAKKRSKQGTKSDSEAMKKTKKWQKAETQLTKAAKMQLKTCKDGGSKPRRRTVNGENKQKKRRLKPKI